MRLWPRPATRGADSDADEAVCAHCDEEISPCRGEAELPRRGRDRQADDCRFGRYVHISGERPGSHLCGTDGQVATPASCPGDTG